MPEPGSDSLPGRRSASSPAAFAQVQLDYCGAFAPLHAARVGDGVMACGRCRLLGGGSASLEAASASSQWRRRLRPFCSVVLKILPSILPCLPLSVRRPSSLVLSLRHVSPTFIGVREFHRKLSLRVCERVRESCGTVFTSVSLVILNSRRHLLSIFCRMVGG